MQQMSEEAARELGLRVKVRANSEWDIPARKPREREKVVRTEQDRQLVLLEYEGWKN